ncbi:MAG TPA: hypothetical protein VLB10_09155 [Gammaproteobacteria bacterium]|jgi:hypothetical protein|nr:hypothetical protein [Gammaproteobacteria bacterium]
MDEIGVSWRHAISIWWSLVRACVLFVSIAPLPSHEAMPERMVEKG